MGCVPHGRPILGPPVAHLKPSRRLSRVGGELHRLRLQGCHEARTQHAQKTGRESPFGWATMWDTPDGWRGGFVDGGVVVGVLGCFS